MIVNIMSAPSASVRLRSKSKTDFSSVFSPTLCPRGNDRGRLFEAALTTNIQRSTGTDTSGLVRNVVQAGENRYDIQVKVKVKWIYIAPSRETSKALRHGSHSAITPMPAFTS